MREDRVVVAGGVELHLLRWDDAKKDDAVPFVLVHGLSSNARTWVGVAGWLTDAGLPVVAVDQRGHGRSDKPDDGYDFPTVAADLAAVISAVGFDRPVVAGQSWGASVALELAEHRPDAVRGVVCVDGGWMEPFRQYPEWEDCLRALTPPPLTGVPSADIEARIRATHPDWPESGIVGTLENFEHRPDGTVAPWLPLDRHLRIVRAIWERHPPELYPSVEVPVLLVPADDDRPRRETGEGGGRARRTPAAGEPDPPPRRRPRPPRPTARCRCRRDPRGARRRILRLVTATTPDPAGPGGTVPRLLTIMGSGETAPTMVKVHRGLLDRLGARPVPAALLDTPYGFQENADQISARAADYFHESVGHDIDVASWRSAADEAVTRERAMAQIRAARYVFAGPGSPTYALDQWRGSELPELLVDKLNRGGAVTFASAAAVTLGVVAVPVYEIYKVGAQPQWRDGLDLMAVAGLDVAVIPHYDNAEGGNHDTRFCYLGERRLRMLEATQPEGAFVLGVDEHTACLFDLDAGTVTVEGHGLVTVRRQGVSTSFPSGSTLTLDELRAAGDHPEAAGHSSATGRSTTADSSALATASVSAGDTSGAASPRDDSPQARPTAGLLADAERLHEAFDVAITKGDVDAAVAAVLELETAIVEWSRDTLQSDEPDRARAMLREMVVRLGDVARTGARDPREVVAPFVEAMLESRRRSRSAGDFDTADELRDRLVAAGIEVRDGPDGSTWHLADADS